MTASNATAAFDDYRTFLISDVETQHFAAQARRHQLHSEGCLVFYRLNVERVVLVEALEDLLRRIAKRAHKHGGGKLAATVDPHVNHVLRIKLEV